MTLTQFYETVGGDYSAVLARSGTEDLFLSVKENYPIVTDAPKQTD